MFIKILLAILLGVASGVFTGLIPGVHINLISALLVSSAPIIIPVIGIYNVIAFIIAMSVTHTFLDVIPSIYLGAPDPDMVLSVLPGHRLLFEGNGLKAVRLTQIGSLGAVILSTLFFPLLLFIVKLINITFIPYFLLAIVIFLLLKSNINSVVLFFFSGILGFLVFNVPALRNPLFPLLTGLFGTGGLLIGLSNNKIPKQSYIPFKITNWFKPIITGEIFGFLTAIFPGLGSASAAALSSAFVKLKENSFLILIGSIGTVNFILSLVTYQVFDKARNGSIVAIKELAGSSTPEIIILSIGATLFAGGLASIILTLLTKPIAEKIMKIDYPKLVKGIIFFLFLLTAILSGWQGIIILITATFIGMLAPLFNVQRIYLMGCLLIPVLNYIL